MHLKELKNLEKLEEYVSGIYFSYLGNNEEWDNYLMSLMEDYGNLLKDEKNAITRRKVISKLKPRKKLPMLGVSHHGKK